MVLSAVHTAVERMKAGGVLPVLRHLVAERRMVNVGRVGRLTEAGVRSEALARGCAAVAVQAAAMQQLAAAAHMLALARVYIS